MNKKAVSVEVLCLEGLKTHSTTLRVIEKDGKFVKKYECPRCGKIIEVSRG